MIIWCFFYENTTLIEVKMRYYFNTCNKKNILMEFFTDMMVRNVYYFKCKLNSSHKILIIVKALLSPYTSPKEFILIHWLTIIFVKNINKRE